MEYGKSITEKGYAVIDDASFAIKADENAYKNRIIEPDYPLHEALYESDAKDNIVNDRMLKPDYSIGKGGGSKNKGRAKPVKRLTGPQRIDKHVNIVKNAEILAETPFQRAERKLKDAIDEMSRVTSMVGRPRQGKELRQVATGSADPSTIAVIRAHGYKNGAALDAYADILSAA